MIWCVYGIIHATYHILTAPEGIKNIIKSYNGTLVPCITLLLILSRPKLAYISNNMHITLLIIFSIFTTLNIGMRIHQWNFGSRISDIYGADDLASPMIINAIRFVENVYALREMGPYSAALGASFLFSKLKFKAVTLIKLISIYLIGIGIFASYISGGRAAIILSVLWIFVISFLYKKYLFMAISIITFCIAIVIININIDKIYSKASFELRRSLQLITIKEDHKSKSAIEGSSHARSELAALAIDTWKSNLKNIIFGKGFEGLTADDDMEMWYGHTGSELFYTLGIKRVATHNLFTDVLLAYGIIGAIIYYSLIFSIIWFIVFLYNKIRIHTIEFSLYCFLIIIVINSCLLANVAGTFISAFTWLYLIYFVTYIYNNQATIYNSSR